MQEDYGELLGHLCPRQVERKASVPGTQWVALFTPSPATTSALHSLLFRVMKMEWAPHSPHLSFISHWVGPFQELLGNMIEGEGIKVASGPTSRKCH